MTRIVFDLDGTLIDSAPDIHLAVNLMLSEQNLAPLDLADVTAFIGNGVPNLVRLAMQARDIDMTQHDACVTSMTHHYGQVNGQLTRLYPGVRIALEQLQRNGHKLALCTNKPLEPACQIVETFELTALFDQIIGGDSLAQRKPEPAMLLACLTNGSGLYVGDSEVDAETADRAGVPFALFTQGYRKTPVAQLVHRYTFDDFSDLAAIVERFANRRD
jgi:phosphoglycolate phosphatase